jgi:hypothetical protein
MDDFLDFILLRAMLSRKILTLGKRSICLVFLANIAVSNSVLDTCLFMILIKLTLSVCLGVNKLQILITFLVSLVGERRIGRILAGRFS